MDNQSVLQTPGPAEGVQNKAKESRMDRDIDRAIDYIIKGSGVRFSGKELRRLDNPCVYVFVKDDLALYVGMSEKGLQRVFGKGHSVAEQCRQECDELLVYYCRTTEDAYKCETILITQLKPKYNRRGSVLHFTDSEVANLGIGRARALQIARNMDRFASV